MSAASHSGTWDSCYVASAPTKLAVSLLTFFSADVSVWMWLCDEIAAAYYVTNAALTGMATQLLGLQLSVSRCHEAPRGTAVFAIVALTSFLISGGYSLEHKCL